MKTVFNMIGTWKLLTICIQYIFTVMSIVTENCYEEIKSYKFKCLHFSKIKLTFDSFV